MVITAFRRMVAGMRNEATFCCCQQPLVQVLIDYEIYEAGIALVNWKRMEGGVEL